MGVVTRIGHVDQICGELMFEWKRPGKLRTRVGSSFLSPVFTFAECRWYLKMHHMELRSEASTDKYMIMSLMRKDNGPPKTVSYKLSCRLDGGREYEGEEVEYQFSRENKGNLSPTLCYKIKLLPIGDTGIPIGDTERTVTCVLRNNARRAVKDVKKLQESLLSMLESREDSDLLIKVRGKEYRAHRSILRARSPVFRSMFSHEMAEKQTGVVTIEDCDPHAFHDFLVHLYSGSCEHISWENVCSLYQAADKYDMGELKAECVNFMRMNLSVDCICDVVSFAKKYDEAKLMKWATKFFWDNSSAIVKTDEWKTLLEENWTVGNELLIKALSRQGPFSEENWIDDDEFTKNWIEELSRLVPFLPGSLTDNLLYLTLNILWVSCFLLFFFL